MEDNVGKVNGPKPWILKHLMKVFEQFQAIKTSWTGRGVMKAEFERGKPGQSIHVCEFGSKTAGGKSAPCQEPILKPLAVSRKTWAVRTERKWGVQPRQSVFLMSPKDTSRAPQHTKTQGVQQGAFHLGPSAWNRLYYAHWVAITAMLGPHQPSRSERF